MGYGHLRAAAALADHWGTEIVEADREPFADATDRLVWSLARRGYHSLSRLSQRGAGRTALARLLDRITAIADDNLHRSGLCSPSILVSKLAIAGN